MKKLILMLTLIFIFIISISFSSAWVYFGEGIQFNPPLSNVTYNVYPELNTTTLAMDNNCVNITGGIYAGNYCYKLNSIELDNYLIFNTADLQCNLDFYTGNVGEVLNLNYYWYNDTNSLIKTGTATCEQDTSCIVDIITASEIGSNNGIYCTISYENDWYNITTEDSKKAYKGTIGQCDATNNNPLVGFEYFDEISNAPVNATNTYNLTFYDGVSNFETGGSFTANLNHTLCTSFSENVSYEMYGQIILEATDYVARVLNINENTPYLIENNPQTDIDLYLIEIDNSTTITYFWQTTNFQSIDGTMLIYKCNTDGTKSLIDSIIVSDGVATSNIQLFTTPYSYNIIINDVLYTDSEYSTCHIESLQERTYRVDISEIDILPTVGQLFINCTLTKISNSTVRMTWEENPNDNSDITACIVGQRQTVLGNVEVYRNCTTAPSGSFIRSVPNNSNNYFIIGELTQNNQLTFCANTISFYQSPSQSQNYILYTLYFTGILIMVIGLVFAGKTTIMFLLTYLVLFVLQKLNIINIPSEIIAVIMCILIIIGVIGSRTRKRQVE